jgi:hypothetical protein
MTAFFTEKSSMCAEDVPSSLGQCLVLVQTFVHNLLTSLCGLGLQKSINVLFVEKWWMNL